MKKSCEKCVCREVCDTPPLTVKAHCIPYKKWWDIKSQKEAKIPPNKFKKFRESIRIKRDICD